MHNVGHWPNLRHLCELLGGAKSLLEAVSFKEVTKSMGLSVGCVLRLFYHLMLNTHHRRRHGVRSVNMNLQLADDDCRWIRSTIWKLTKQTPWQWITPILIDTDNLFNNDVIMSSLLKKLSISIKIHVVKPL